MDAASVTLTVGDYVLYSVMGICVVFFALILLIAVIKIMTWEPKKAAPATASAGAAAGGVSGSSAPAPSKPLAPGTAGECKLYGTDPRDAALIMAIVADEMKKPLNELRFISIKEAKSAQGDGSSVRPER